MYNYYYDNYLQHCKKRYEAMCPSVYREIAPIVVRVCMEDDNNIYVFPNEKAVDDMVEKVCKYYDEQNKTRDDYDGDDEYRRRRRGIFGDFVRFLILRNLFDRRRRCFGRRPFGGYGYYDCY
ncbi:hypothetical protein [Alkalithermobacter paradoxus]|uniref:Uncharacterized protein n=1 Tax=Alkalithermobacter paradoxus TaxID=29349 RepID=A0A1V4I9T5_9FIRM|nr:hypothetical protein CLOTH_07890 [[Clostridium] thermoalcaliphilum]